MKDERAEQKIVFEESCPTMRLAWAPDGNLLALHGADNKVRLRSLAGKDRGSFPLAKR
jgi:hypothetical protein